MSRSAISLSYAAILVLAVTVTARAEPAPDLQRALEIWRVTENFCYPDDPAPAYLADMACGLSAEATDYLRAGGCQFSEHEHWWHCPE